jgi:hypothetical protein
MLLVALTHKKLFSNRKKQRKIFIFLLHIITCQKGEKYMKPRKYLKVRGMLHSFAFELGRLTKSGWHYYVDLSSQYAPSIVHHGKYWVVTPFKRGAFSVSEIIIFNDHIEIYGKGERYDGLFAPSIGKVSAKKLYNEILKAIVKYTIGAFLQKRHADGSFYIIDLNYKLVPKRIKQDDKLKLIDDDKSLLAVIDDIVNSNIYVRLDSKHTPMLKNKGFTETWKILPYTKQFFLINDKYILAYDIISKYNLMFENHYHGIKLCNDYYISAKDLYEAILSSLARYSLQRFGVDTTKFSKLELSFQSTG